MLATRSLIPLASRSGSVLALVAALGCGSAQDGEQPPLCIVGGGASEPLLLMSGEEADAITRIRIEGVAGEGEYVATCTAVLLAPEWALTARHCAPDLTDATGEVLFGAQDSVAVGVGAEGSCGTQLRPTLAIPVRELVPHPELDLLLVGLEKSPGAGGVDVVPARAAARDEAAIGLPVELAGFGRSDTGASSVRRFAVSELAGVDTSSLTVDGRGRSGACQGDSGGPLLIRDASGAVAVLGVLSSGSTTCTGVDEYVRLSAVSSWIEAHVGSSNADGQPALCGGLDGSGRCYAGTAVWCEGDERRATPCPLEMPCGWSTADGGYRCLPAAEDPCRGITDLGRCDATSATRCVGGVLTQESCAHGCSRSAVTGASTCLP